VNFGTITWTHVVGIAIFLVLLWAKLDGWG